MNVKADVLTYQLKAGFSFSVFIPFCSKFSWDLELNMSAIPGVRAWHAANILAPRVKVFARMPSPYKLPTLFCFCSLVIA
ncbi:hypothetical protein K9N68_25005 [Kovacikia minuta CCNUW1]|uniref:hypothetical protein n=1 Tax=Kovacikia minuta TaxID=2931930 RepID=UPI001CC93962|nr:hypothetical protein [Kovacikia minuta]UBF24886.1 hypothetical protein K9N68_25005 [Kovacikia minuta CCNUW1]